MFRREETIEKLWLDEQKSNTKVHQADELFKDRNALKGNRNFGT